MTAFTSAQKKVERNTGIDDEACHEILASCVKAGEDLVFRTRIVYTVLNEYNSRPQALSGHISKATPFVDLQSPSVQTLQEHTGIDLAAADQLPAKPRPVNLLKKHLLRLWLAALLVPP